MHERSFVVQLHGRRAGLLRTSGDTTWFVLDAAYLDDPERAVLGLRFEESRKDNHRSHMRLPPWFSNLLPEGPLRRWIAIQRGVALQREMELLAEVGNDLPGAVTVASTDDEGDPPSERKFVIRRPRASSGAWRFSLAGVQLKFSMLRAGERFTAPAGGEGGDWIVKLPDPQFPRVPENEFAMMTLASKVGIDVPDIKLLHREQVQDIPAHLWPDDEPYAFAIRRFDRAAGGERIHMEDLAQVRGFYPDEKYSGSFETVAGLVYRRRNLESLREFVRRLTFNALIGNGDAHLKNWSLLYLDPRVPQLSPAYDIVATGIYPGVDHDLGLTLDGSRRFEDVTLNCFSRMEAKLGADGASLADVAREIIERVRDARNEVEPTLEHPTLRKIGESITRATTSLGRI